MNKIHPTVIIDGDVKLGENNEILPYSILYGPLEIGDNNWIGPQVVIGTPGEDTKDPRHDSSNKLIKIGNNNIIREHVAVQKPCYRDITQIGNDIFLMHGAHVPHDAILHDGVTLAPNVVVGGISQLLQGCNIGMGATLHQCSIIGHYSIVATNAAAIKNVKPFSRFIPGKPISVNTYAIHKYGFEKFESEIEAYVLENVFPESTKLVAIINQFETLHLASKRGLY
jgi:UDP-N-acetylglucosamine acyltransferase